MNTNRTHHFAVAVFLTMLTVQMVLAQKISHPLNPLSWQEYWTVLEVLESAGHLDSDTRFSMINLKGPDKKKVWNWEAETIIPRIAFATVHQAPKTYYAEVDLTANRLVQWKELTDVQPPFLTEEFYLLVDEVKKHPDFIAAMKKRGIDNFALIDCYIDVPAYFGTEEQGDRRIGHCFCEEGNGVRNTWSRQIEGLTTIVDLQKGEVIRVVDEGVIPMATVSGDYDAGSIEKVRPRANPIHTTQPLGPSFVTQDHVISWENWTFHVKPDHRVGMVLSTVTYKDQAKERPILYQGYLSEIFVPYMDPSFAWYHRTFLDGGEFSHGGLTKPLLPGLDAPMNAMYMDGLVCNDYGRPVHRANMIAIFERQTGDPAWRHYSPSIGSESRIKRELVVRSAAVIGNYDYLFDWIFQQDGSVTVKVGATGIVEAKVSAQDDALSTNKNTRLPGDAYGRFVDSNVVAVNHSHYFSFRLDLDVDGTNNHFQMDRLRQKMLPEPQPRRSIWVVEPLIAKEESQAKLNINLEKPALWRVLSTTQKNHVGYPTSYHVAPGKTASSLLSMDDYPRRRAGFINHHLWVTPYHAKELFAAGDFPTLSKPGMGLPTWTKKNRSLEGGDVVLWYTMGMHHVVRAEDWPVMPVMWHSFQLRPFDFFDRNPALDLPKVKH